MKGLSGSLFIGRSIIPKSSHTELEGAIKSDSFGDSDNTMMFVAPQIH